MDTIAPNVIFRHHNDEQGTRVDVLHDATARIFRVELWDADAGQRVGAVNRTDHVNAIELAEKIAKGMPVPGDWIPADQTLPATMRAG